MRVMKLTVPARVVSYMSGTGWGQEADPEGATDPVRQRLVEAMRRPAKDGTLRLTDPEPALLARLAYEADHCADGWRYGDHDADTYAEMRAAMKLLDAIAAIDPAIRPDTARTLMYAEQPATG